MKIVDFVLIVANGQQFSYLFITEQTLPLDIIYKSCLLR